MKTAYFINGLILIWELTYYSKYTEVQMYCWQNYCLIYEESQDLKILCGHN